MSYRSKLTLVITNGVIALAVLLYMASPIDLVPDFIPVLGWLDDLASLSSLLGLTAYTLNAITDGQLTAALIPKWSERPRVQAAPQSTGPRVQKPDWANEASPVTGMAFDPDEALTLEQIRAL